MNNDYDTELFESEQQKQLNVITSTNVLWIRNCRHNYKQDAGRTLRVHSTAGSTFLRETSWPPSWKCDIKSKNPTVAIDAHLFEEQSCQISSQADLKRLLLKRLAPSRTTRLVAIWDQFLIQKCSSSEKWHHQSWHNCQQQRIKKKTKVSWSSHSWTTHGKRCTDASIDKIITLPTGWWYTLQPTLQTKILNKCQV